MLKDLGCEKFWARIWRFLIYGVLDIKRIDSPRDISKYRILSVICQVSTIWHIGEMGNDFEPSPKPFHRNMEQKIEAIHAGGLPRNSCHDLWQTDNWPSKSAGYNDEFIAALKQNLKELGCDPSEYSDVDFNTPAVFPSASPPLFRRIRQRLPRSFTDPSLQISWAGLSLSCIRRI